MDSVTLAVICDKCVKDGLVGEEYKDVWEKFAKRALELCLRLVIIRVWVGRGSFGRSFMIQPLFLWRHGIGRDD